MKVYCFACLTRYMQNFYRIPGTRTVICEDCYNKLTLEPAIITIDGQAVIADTVVKPRKRFQGLAGITPEWSGKDFQGFIVYLGGQEKRFPVADHNYTRVAFAAALESRRQWELKEKGRTNIDMTRAEFYLSQYQFPHMVHHG